MECLTKYEKEKSNNVAMEIYGSLNLFKMVENVVKKTKISTLSSIILDNLLRKKNQKKF